MFRDRIHAGQKLATLLQHYKSTKAFIFALLRGGLPLAAEMSRDLHLPFDVLIVRKIGAPFHPELALGALCETDDPLWNQDLLDRLGVSKTELNKTIAAETARIKEQTDLFRQGFALPSLEGRAVILVDDGLATGATMRAAINFVQRRNPLKVVVAVPVAAKSSADALRKSVDNVVVDEEHENFRSVGEWYQDFSQVTNQEVIAALPPLGDLVFPDAARGLVLFAHGSGSSRLSPRNRAVARALNQRGFGTYLFDLLSDEESHDHRNIFDIELLSDRLVGAVERLRTRADLANVPFALFGASTGGAAAVVAAEKLQDRDPVFAVVSRGGRPDLAGESLSRLVAPTLLIVGDKDFEVLELNRAALRKLPRGQLKTVAGATHLFEEKGALEQVAELAADWLEEQAPHAPRPPQGAESRVQL